MIEIIATKLISSGALNMMIILLKNTDNLFKKKIEHFVFIESSLKNVA